MSDLYYRQILEKVRNYHGCEPKEKDVVILSKYSDTIMKGMIDKKDKLVIIIVDVGSDEQPILQEVYKLKDLLFDPDFICLKSRVHIKPRLYKLWYKDLKGIDNEDRRIKTTN